MVISFRISIIFELVFIVTFLDILEELLVLLRGLILCDLGLHRLNLLGSIQLGGFASDLYGSEGSLDCELVLVYLVLHGEHLEVGLDGELARGIEVEVKLIFVDLIEVLLYVVEILESLPQETLPDESLSAFNLVPHALHVVHIEALVFTRVLAEEGHGCLRILSLVVA